MSRRPPRRCPYRVAIEALEFRQLLSVAGSVEGLLDPAPREQYIIELLNRMRADPAAELPRLLNSSDPNVNDALNSLPVDRTLLAQQWATLIPAQPIAWNAALAASATSHTQALLAADTQSHQLPGEPDIGTRVLNAGYDFAAVGETVFAYAQSPFHAHAAFAIDWDTSPTAPGHIQSPPGHRQVMMNPTLRDMGMGLLDVPFGHQTGPMIITEDFGQPRLAGNATLLGVAYADNDRDGFYSIGEGLAGLTVTVAGNGLSLTTHTLTAGSYQLSLAPGSYSVTFSGAALSQSIVRLITIGADNLKLDLALPGAPGTPANHTPTGYLDAVTPTTIAGWAFDQDAGAASLQVRLDIDGATVTTVAANHARFDLTPVVGSPFHGFAIPTPAVSPGPHTFSLYAIDPNTNAATLLGLRTTSVNTLPTGYVDVADAQLVSGWAYDPDAPDNPIAVALEIDQALRPDSTAANPRPDIIPVTGNPNHGFTLALPQLPTGAHSLRVLARDAATGQAAVLASTTITVADPIVVNHVATGSRRPAGYVDLLNADMAAGWVADLDSPDTPVQLRLDVDGIAGTRFGTTVVRPDLASVIGSTLHGFSVHLPALSTASHRVDLWAFDVQTDTPILLASRHVLATPPQGWIDALTPTSIAGWALDLDTPNQALDVRIDIAGMPSVTLSASGLRSDLARIFGTGAHAFSYTPANIPAGPHQVTITAMNARSGLSTVLAQQTLTF